MACPYFFPAARLDQSSWAIPPRLPLGDAYGGECRAPASGPQPDEERVRQVCNVGYGRNCCERFPQQAVVEAIRFHIVEDTNALLRIQYVLEKECWPAGNGLLECATESRAIRGADDEILRRQATAFVESYLRRKKQELASGA